MAPSGLGLSWVLIIWKVAETLDGWHRSGPGAVPGTVPLQAWNGDQQCRAHRVPGPKFVSSAMYCAVFIFLVHILEKLA